MENKKLETEIEREEKKRKHKQKEKTRKKTCDCKEPYIEEEMVNVIMYLDGPVVVKVGRSG